LVEKLTEAIYKEDVIDFAKQENVVSGLTHYRARIFVTPKDKTQILKTILP